MVRKAKQANQAKHESVGLPIRLTSSLLALVISYILVILGWGIVLKFGSGFKDSSTVVQGTLVHPEGKSRYLRSDKPESTGFSYKLANAKYLIPSNTSFEVVQSIVLVNGETWHFVKLPNKAEILDLNGQPLKTSGEQIDGWIAGKTREGEFITTVSEVRLRKEDPQEFLFQAAFLLLGSFVGLLVWKIVSHQSFDESEWEIRVLAIEGVFFFHILTCLAFLGMSLQSVEISGPVLHGNVAQIELDSAYTSAFLVFMRGWLGASTLGFVMTLFTCRFLSISERSLNEKDGGSYSRSAY